MANDAMDCGQMIILHFSGSLSPQLARVANAQRWVLLFRPERAHTENGPEINHQ